MFVGISNQISKSGTTDIPREMELVHWLTTMYDDLELLLDRSPLMHASKAHTPLLIMHGKEDRRVDPGQSRELYRALKHKGDVPVRLVYYPGEGHGNRKSASRYDYNLRMMRWFDHFLLGGSKDLPPWRLEYPLLKTDTDEDGEES
ncbi:MAG: prolyl oligopeptidase family serine peptidase, partial [Acidobacteriota bacterium]